MGIAELIIAIVGGIVALTGGAYLAVHEFRRRERRVTRREIDELTTEVDALRELLLEQRRYIYRLVTLMIDAGLDPPHPPDPSFDPGEYDEGPSDTPGSSQSDETGPEGT